MLTALDIRNSLTTILGREPGDAEVDSLTAFATARNYDQAQLTQTVRSSSEAVTVDLNGAMASHLYSIHRARVALMATVLPPARKILDLGGANSPLCDSGYPHTFDELVIIDLPPEDRHDEFAGRMVTDRVTPRGPVRVAYTSMTDLAMFDDDSVDLVWSGQSIEHISIEQAHDTYREVARVLHPDGWFCLDTPNRLVTRIHAEGGMIHPDHQHEYTPSELIGELEAAGFGVVNSLGVCDMPLTTAAGRIDYRDFAVGAGITRSLDSAYIQYHACQLATAARP